ncbi:Protein of unknown function [Bacillus cereus]|uniref:Uncharacterized protein n=2 Tax=Bacillus cereus group TaxID=86661 RepID=A0A1C4EH09_9BACI|nr:Protein of unknown function [Bacillus wiedmannii]SCC49359.1 Protein of unknown function [Bacillus thuringiensis]SCC52476.1 Protein of unknown function [Bacillus cereus]SCC42830.1 Protein of unknown function [Bacillus wiedmannii]SCM98481.1 Protein of unknown function [Bacillus cereus]
MRNVNTSFQLHHHT